MRSKEVDEAINDLMYIVVTDIYDNEVRIDKTKVINEYNQSVGTVLDYIKELEKRDKAVLVYFDKEGNPIEYINKQVIRDKIKELEHEKSKRTQLGVFMLKNYENQRLLAQIEVLKSMIGE